MVIALHTSEDIDLLSNASGAGSGEAPLHKLGSGQWEKVLKAKRSADVAAKYLRFMQKVQSG